MRASMGGIVLGLAFLLLAPPSRADEPAPLPGTKPLTMEGDLAAQMVDGVDRYLLRKLDESTPARARHWKRDVSSVDAYQKSIEPNRKRLAAILGVRDARPERVRIHERVQVPVGLLDAFDFFPPPDLSVHQVRWPAFADVHGEGLLLDGGIKRIEKVEDIKPLVTVIVIGDADQTPEQLAGLMPGVPDGSQVARRLAESGIQVLAPVLIDRTVAARNGRAKMTNREYIYRPSFELGRHPLGFEIQKVLALVDAIKTQPVREIEDLKELRQPVALFGYGEGGAVALYAAALDPRIDAVCVSGYLDDRNEAWQHPIDRNIFGLLDQFGDAELLSMIAPRPVIVEACKGPELTLPPGMGGAPGRLASPRLDRVRAELARAAKLVEGLKPQPRIDLVVSGAVGDGPFGTDEALAKLLASVSPDQKFKPAPVAPPPAQADDTMAKVFDERMRRDIAERQTRQLHELDRHTQQLLAESPYVRAEFMKQLDTSSIEKYKETVEAYRTRFRDEVIGRFDDTPLPPEVRSRRVYDEAKYTGYEVVMDVFPDVFAYGILLMPKGIKEGDRRPVVVCQHGLEGRPQDVADPKINNKSYNQYAIRLAERGFITFAPQNLYIGHDRFRTLQRKANLLGKTLFSIIVPQHQQMTDWLKSLPMVDPERIAFYGLSYGGKSAMRIPPLVSNYALSICSADFNEWVWKNASTRSPYSYVWTPEYEIFEWDLGSTFNYAEMAALIAPRPFMVERGHFDGVSSDEAVAYEFAKVRFLYEARLGLGDRCAIEFFTGPHTIHGVGTFDFLHKHLNWPKPAE